MNTAALHTTRNNSLDALRGISILLMVLSGSIAFGGVLPAWMYHAQVPPPDHKFHPEIPGITWVDLVFPFFLFSMGAAIPLALYKWEAKPNAAIQVWWIATRRWLLLTWFALFTYHMRAWVIAETPGATNHLLSILAFLLLFFELYRPEGENRSRLFLMLRIVAYAISGTLLWLLPFHSGAGFLLSKSDIIIIVLGNMAFFGTLIWWYTRHKPWLRIGILPFIMAIFLGAKTAGSWNEVVFNWSPLPWMYKFYYLKYLFIIIPGMFAGEWMKKRNDISIPPAKLSACGWLLLLVIVINVCLLYNRALILNLSLTIVILVSAGWLLKAYPDSLSYRLFSCGTYLLLLGLFFEAYEGGIKKDSSTYSYYFVTSGLACFLLVTFNAWQAHSPGRKLKQLLASNGQNPMVAYVAGSLLITPLLQLTGLIRFWNKLDGNPWLGFLKGLLFTGAVALVTWFFTRKKWFWKT